MAQIYSNMHKLTFYFFYIGINLFRLVPFWLLYLKGWLTYLLIYHAVKYRRKVVIENLHKSFPEKDEAAIKQLAQKFYRENLSAIFVEGLKGFTMSQQQFKRRYRVVNPEILDAFFEKGQDVIALATHYTNWEWGIQAVNAQIKHQAAALYKPMTNLYIERYSKKLREASGMELVPITETKAFFKSKKVKPVLYIMAADQFPGGMIDKAIWLEFLGRKTPCLHGPESYARFNNLPTVFFDVRRVKRGYYELEIKPMFDDPTALEPESITKTYMALLEERIRKYPSDWLWSHKRWKHEK